MSLDFFVFDSHTQLSDFRYEFVLSQKGNSTKYNCFIISFFYASKKSLKELKDEITGDGFWVSFESQYFEIFLIITCKMMIGFEVGGCGNRRAKGW